MKKKMVKLLALVLTLMFVMIEGASATDYSLFTLSPNNKCPIHPQVYCSPRYKDPGKEAYDLKNGLQAYRIENPTVQGREYGLYFKFTPGKVDNGYRITRFDIVIRPSKGQPMYTEGFDTDMVCQYGRYWCWDFYSLEGFFDDMRWNYGGVLTGTYIMEVYFNSQWAGEVSFKIL